MRHRSGLRAAVVVLGASLASTGCHELFPQRSEGEKLYRKLCAECHGLDGRGNVPRYMGNNAADLIDDTWKTGGDPGSIEYVVREGVFGQMPANPDLTRAEMKALLEHLRNLRGETY